MNNLKEILLSELPNFREKSLKFLNGEISKPEYKGFSGGYGVYAQRDKKSFMIRLRTSCGVISKSQLYTIYNMAYENKLEKIHLTTRQAIQLHGLTVEQICNIMEEGIHKDIFTRGGGGNFPRNVGLSPLSGVDPDEAFDVTPYAVATDKHFISKITTYHLPRKLKVSYSSCNHDDAHCTVQDLGFIATLKDNKPYFNVYVGGGLGKNPKVGLKLDEPIEAKDALYYVEGLTKLFIDYGNYENKNKARVRYIVDELGEEDFIEKFKEYSLKEKEKGGLDLTPDPIDYSKEGIEVDICDHRIRKQKQKGLYTVYIHPFGDQLYLKDLKALLYELDKIKNPMIRIGMTEGMYILNLNGKEAEKILEVSKKISGDSSLEESICCIGVPICQMGIQNSQKMLNTIIDYFRENVAKETMHKLPRLYISGCPNSCGVHQIGSIGLTGKMKNIDGTPTDVFEIYICGNFEVGKSRLGTSIGDFKATDIPEFLHELAKITEGDFFEFATNNTEKVLEVASKYKL